MTILLCIGLIAAGIVLVFTLCALGLQAARAGYPKYEVPPTAYSYQIDHQADEIEQVVAKRSLWRPRTPGTFVAQANRIANGERQS